MHLEECDQVMLPCPFNAHLQCGCPMVRRCDWSAHQGQMAFHHARLTADKVESVALANRDDACVVGAAPAPTVVDDREPSDALEVGRANTCQLRLCAEQKREV